MTASGLTGVTLAKPRVPTQITRLSLTHSPHRLSFHSWEIPRWPLASHQVPSVHDAFTVSSLTERRIFIHHVVPCSEFSPAQRWQFALFWSRSHLLLMTLIARYKSIVTENRRQKNRDQDTHGRVWTRSSRIRISYSRWIEREKKQIEIIYSFIWNNLYAFWSNLHFLTNAPQQCGCGGCMVTVLCVNVLKLFWCRTVLVMCTPLNCPHCRYGKEWPSVRRESMQFPQQSASLGMQSSALMQIWL